MVELISQVRLGRGEKARKLLGISGVPCGEAAVVKHEEAEMEFEDLELRSAGARDEN